MSLYLFHPIQHLFCWIFFITWFRQRVTSRFSDINFTIRITFLIFVNWWNFWGNVDFITCSCQSFNSSLLSFLIFFTKLFFLSTSRTNWWILIIAFRSTSIFLCIKKSRVIVCFWWLVGWINGSSLHFLIGRFRIWGYVWGSSK